MAEEEGTVDAAVDAVTLEETEISAPLKPKNKVMNKVMNKMSKEQVLDVGCAVDCWKRICAPCILVVCRLSIL